MRPRQWPISQYPIRALRWLRTHWKDEWCIAGLAVALSLGAFAWYDLHGLTAAFNDARVREIIARRVVISRTPGIAQLGSTWLPLGSILMLPFVWNDTLFRTGIAGSLPSMAAYVVMSVYLYRLARNITSSRGAGWAAAITLMVNPNLLYMQTTAMSETTSICAFVIAIYYAHQLTQGHRAADIVKCATAVAAGTLIRYENWVVAIVLLPMLAYAAWRYKGRLLAEAWAILYAMLAFVGCAGWILYNAIIFHDPLLSFFYGQTSHSYYANTPDLLLPARHHPLVAFEMYGYTVVGTTGWLLVALAIVGLILFVGRFRGRFALPVLLSLAPFGFYWLVMTAGANTESLPEFGMGSYYNVRFGLMMIPAVGLFLSFVVIMVRIQWRTPVLVVTLIAILGSSVIGTTMETPFVLREAQREASAVAGPESESQLQGDTEAQWFVSQYRGGNVLVAYVNNSSFMFSLLTKHDFADRAFITDANGSQFDAALEHPQTSVTWIVMNSSTANGESKIWRALAGRQDWRQYFVLVKSFGPTQFYERTAAAA